MLAVDVRRRRGNSGVMQRPASRSVLVEERKKNGQVGCRHASKPRGKEINAFVSRSRHASAWPRLVAHRGFPDGRHNRVSYHHAPVTECVHLMLLKRDAGR